MQPFFCQGTLNMVYLRYLVRGAFKKKLVKVGILFQPAFVYFGDILPNISNIGSGLNYSSYFLNCMVMSTSGPFYCRLKFAICNLQPNFEKSCHLKRLKK